MSNLCCYGTVVVGLDDKLLSNSGKVGKKVIRARNSNPKCHQLFKCNNMSEITNRFTLYMASETWQYASFTFISFVMYNNINLYCLFFIRILLHVCLHLYSIILHLYKMSFIFSSVNFFYKPYETIWNVNENRFTCLVYIRESICII